MKFVFFSVSENGENGLGDEGAEPPPPEFWGYNRPWQLQTYIISRKYGMYWSITGS